MEQGGAGRGGPWGSQAPSYWPVCRPGPSLTRHPHAKLDVQGAAGAAGLDLRLEAVVVLLAVLRGWGGAGRGSRVGAGASQATTHARYKRKRQCTRTRPRRTLPIVSSSASTTPAFPVCTIPLPMPLFPTALHAAYLLHTELLDGEGRQLAALGLESFVQGGRVRLQTRQGEGARHGVVGSGSREVGYAAAGTASCPPAASPQQATVLLSVRQSCREPRQLTRS